MSEERIVSKSIIGKTIVSQSAKTIGKVNDLVFETKTGELIYIVVSSPTPYANSFDLEKDSEGNLQIPFSSVIAIGDFVVIQEEDL